MPLPAKKKKPNNDDDVKDQEPHKEKVESSSDDDDDDDEDGLEAYDGNEEIQIDFEGRTPMETDFHGVRQLLQQLFLKAPINLSELSDIIIGQEFVGSVVFQLGEPDEGIQDDGDDWEELKDAATTVFGIISAVNITNQLELGCIQEIRAYILQRARKHAKPAMVKRFEETIASTTAHVGFLLNERYVNIPPQISVPMLQSLADEVSDACDDGMPFDFKFYIMIVKFYRQAARKGRAAEDLYSNAEEEQICKQALAEFEYSVAGEQESAGSSDWNADSGLTPFRKIVLFEAAKLPALIDSIKQLMNE